MAHTTHSAEPRDHPRPAVHEIIDAWSRELPGVRTDSIEVITPLWRAAKTLADDRTQTLNRLGLDSATLDLLSTLRRSGSPYTLTTRDLAEQCLVSAGAISQRVTRAEAAGLVRRDGRSSSDRSVLVSLTQAAHELIEPVVRSLLNQEAQNIAHLTEHERAQLGELLHKLVHKA